MLSSGEISQVQFNNALKRIPRINGSDNPRYVDQLSQAFKGLTIGGKLEVWEKMSAAEQQKHKGELMKTYFNMLGRQDKSRNEKDKIKERMKQASLI